MKSDSWTHSHLEALLNRLGEDNARKLLGCREVTVAFDIGNTATVTAHEPLVLKVWQTIEIGTKSGNGLYLYAERQREAFMVARTEDEIDLVKLSTADLGLAGHVCYEAIYSRAVELGLQLCPVEVVRQLKLRYYCDEPRDVSFAMAVEAAYNAHGNLHVFFVERGGWRPERNIFEPCLAWSPGLRFVFRLPACQ